jgi:hypothetical protein
MRNLVTAMLLVSFAFTALPLGAHSFSAYFDGTQPFSVSGTIVKVDWVRPDVFIHVRVEDKATGKVDVWAFETLPPQVLTGAYKVTRDMFREGDTMTIVGWKAKPAANWKNVIPDPDVLARVLAEKPAYAAQFQFADGRKVAVVQQVPNLP